MRCYFLRGGHIGTVEILTDASDEAAINQAKTLFEKRSREFERFEVWDRSRLVYQHPGLPSKHAGTTTEPKSYYRLYLLDDDGCTQGQYDFLAESDQAAHEIARISFDACSDRATQFEVLSASLLMASGKCAGITFEEVGADRQAQVIEVLEQIHDSNWAAASSERLLERLEVFKARSFVSSGNEGPKPSTSPLAAQPSRPRESTHEQP